MTLDLFLFSIEPRLILPAVTGGVAAVVVDLERRDKETRQRGADTLISGDTLADLRHVRSHTPARVICRIDAAGPGTHEQIDAVLDAGADEVLVPMVRTLDDARLALDAAAGRCAVGILIETRDALARARDLASLDVSRVYVGLNDLSIEMGTPSLFTALVDGTLDRIRAAVRDVPFGFGGMTLPDRGAPVPARLLLGELARLRADFTFLRRSFWRDVEGMDPAEAIRQIRAAAEVAARRDPAAVAADRIALETALAVPA